MTARTYIKICGLTQLADARAAIAAGVDFLGFILVPQSPRCLSPAQAQQLIQALPPETVTVGVTVNQTPAQLQSLRAFCSFSFLQLHGDEPAECAQQLGPESVWKAWHLCDSADVAAAAAYPAATIVADTMLPGQRGGTGQTGNWQLARDLAQRSRLLLAGGICPENVAAAIAAVQPYGVDVSSGIETAPGRKDLGRLRELVAEVRRTSGAGG